MKKFVSILAALALATPALPQEPVFRSNVKLVVVNVSVTGRDGKPVENLTKDDFQVFEDGKQQKVETIDLMKLDAKPLPAMQLAARPAPNSLPLVQPQRLDMQAALEKFQDRRMIVMLFDFASMEPAEQIRSIEAAQKFIGTQITSSDVVMMMTYSSALKTLLDFTGDRDAMLAALDKLRVGEGSELAALGDEGADSQDVSGQFVADETEFNIFNTDLKLAALEDAARQLAQYPEKKALVYFSSGVPKTGVDNQSQLRATINTAVRANVAFYPIDARGLQASAPGGDASQAGSVGNNLYSGKGQKSLRDSYFDTQETIYSLAADTGGKALLDSNDLTLGIRAVQQDVESYYIVAYRSTNAAEDGRFRRIQVKLAPRLETLKAKLNYRQGYYAPTTFARMNSTDKESLLQEAMSSENPVTDLPLAVEVDYFRLAKGKYFVPVAVKIPGSALAFKTKGSKAATEMDFIGEVQDPKGHPLSVVRDTIPIKLDQETATEVSRKQIQYDTGFTLGPGKYKLRFVARENGEGKTGTFETGFTVPDLGAGNGLRVSSVILSNQREPLKQQIASAENNKKLLAENPLIQDGAKMVPNVTKVFRQGQQLLVYFEVYDPGAPEGMQAGRFADIEATLSFFQGARKVFETQPVRANRLGTRGDAVVPVHVSAALASLKPGQYVAQVNVIDEFGKKFAFPRSNFAVLASAQAPASAPQSTQQPAP